jgi:hypothetical protein
VKPEPQLDAAPAPTALIVIKVIHTLSKKITIETTCNSFLQVPFILNHIKSEDKNTCILYFFRLSQNAYSRTGAGAALKNFHLGGAEEPHQNDGAPQLTACTEKLFDETILWLGKCMNFCFLFIL